MVMMVSNMGECDIERAASPIPSSYAYIYIISTNYITTIGIDRYEYDTNPTTQIIYSLIDGIGMWYVVCYMYV